MPELSIDEAIETVLDKTTFESRTRSELSIVQNLHVAVYENYYI